jgi:hypothetical protein
MKGIVTGVAKCVLLVQFLITESVLRLICIEQV